MTFNDQSELARSACAEATRAGAKEARVTVSRTRYVTLSYRERKVETLEESVTNGLYADLYVDGKYSGHSTSDLRPEAISKFFQEAVAMTRYLAEDPHRRLPEAQYYANRPSTDLQLVDATYRRVTPEERHRFAQAVEAAALDAGGDKIISTTANYYDSITESSVVASNGFEGRTERTEFWGGADVTARDAGDKRPEDWWWEGGCYQGRLADPGMIGKKAVERALSRIGSEKIATEKMSIVVENRVAGRLFNFMSGALQGRNLQQRQSFFEGKLGQQVASPLLTVVDDPLVVHGLASRHFDYEGISARRLPIVEKGVLRNFYIDSYYGRKLSMEPTTGSASNVIVEPGDRDQAAWMKELGRGILVTGFLGGNSNSSTGDFSAGVAGFLFDKGEIVQPVSEMNLASNHLEFWHKLIGVGNDPYPFSSLKTPCLVFEGITMAGA
jgi:PmbA protein